MKWWRVRDEEGERVIVALPLNVTRRAGHRPEVRNRKRWRDNSYFIRRDKLIGPGGKGPLDLLCVRDGKIEVGFVPRRVVACGDTRMEGSSKRNMRTRWGWLHGSGTNTQIDFGKVDLNAIRYGSRLALRFKIHLACTVAVAIVVVDVTGLRERGGRGRGKLLSTRYERGPLDRWC
jgi:hypothetical protein